MVKIFDPDLYNIRIVNIISKNYGYLLFLGSIEDMEKIFSANTEDSLRTCGFSITLPPELKSSRSIIVKRIHNSIFENNVEDIKNEIERCNVWCKVNEVIKLSSTGILKIVCESTDIRQKVLESGLLLFKMFIPQYMIAPDKYISLVTCFKCYELEDHTSRNCPKSTDFKICSSCSSTSHTWKDCSSPQKKCLLCSGTHNALSSMCPERKKAIKLKRNLGGSGEFISNGPSYSRVVKNNVNTHQLTVTPDVLSKTVSCITLALFKDNEIPGSFNETLNSLLAGNGLSKINLEGFVPPVLQFINKPLISAEVPLPTQNKMNSQNTSRIDPNVSSMSNSKYDNISLSTIRIYKKKTTAVNSNDDIISGWIDGTLIITNPDDSPASNELVSKLNSCKRNMKNNITDLKVADFENMKRNIDRKIRAKNFSSLK